jgi:opacity protein-like surface antigen
MKRFLIGVGCASFLALTGPAFAQTAPRAYVQGTVGPSFGTVASVVFAGGLGVRVGRGIHVTGEAGRMLNALPKSVQAEADALAEEMQTATGSAVSISARAPAVYATGGLRWSVPSQGVLHPYLGVSAGVARVTPRVRATVDGVSLETDGRDESMTEPLIGVCGGLTMDVGRRLAVDVGYHYNRVFTSEPVINTSRIVIGLLARF